LVATPAAGFHLVSWSGDASGAANPLHLTIVANTQITATFAPDSFPVAVTINGQGSVTRQPDLAAYPLGSSLTLTAAPAPGRTFTGWSGDASGSTNPLSVLVDGPKAITATFVVNSYTLTTNVAGTGMVQRSPDLATYPHGTLVTLTALPPDGWRFVA